MPIIIAILFISGADTGNGILWPSPAGYDLALVLHSGQTGATPNVAGGR